MFTLLLWIFCFYVTLEFFEVDTDFAVFGFLLCCWPLLWVVFAAEKAAEFLRRKVK